MAAASLLLVRLGAKWWAVLLAWLTLVEVGYHLRGSIGKTFTRLSVPITSRWQYYLRETVGKLASASTFGIGFLMVFGNERLALHDYIAKTKVVRTVSRPRVQQAMVSASFMVGLTLFWVLCYQGRQDQWTPSC